MSAAASSSSSSYGAPAVVKRAGAETVVAYENVKIEPKLLWPEIVYASNDWPDVEPWVPRGASTTGSRACAYKNYVYRLWSACYCDWAGDSLPLSAGSCCATLSRWLIDQERAPAPTFARFDDALRTICDEYTHPLLAGCSAEAAYQYVFEELATECERAGAPWSQRASDLAEASGLCADARSPIAEKIARKGVVTPRGTRVNINQVPLEIIQVRRRVDAGVRVFAGLFRNSDESATVELVRDKLKSLKNYYSSAEADDVNIRIPMAHIRYNYLHPANALLTAQSGEQRLISSREARALERAANSSREFTRRTVVFKSRTGQQDDFLFHQRSNYNLEFNAPVRYSISEEKPEINAALWRHNWTCPLSAAASAVELVYVDRANESLAQLRRSSAGRAGARVSTSALMESEERERDTSRSRYAAAAKRKRESKGQVDFIDTVVEGLARFGGLPGPQFEAWREALRGVFELWFPFGLPTDQPFAGGDAPAVRFAPRPRGPGESATLAHGWCRAYLRVRSDLQMSSIQQPHLIVHLAQLNASLDAEDVTVTARSALTPHELASIAQHARVSARGSMARGGKTIKDVQQVNLSTDPEITSAGAFIVDSRFTNTYIEDVIETAELSTMFQDGDLLLDAAVAQMDFSMTHARADGPVAEDWRRRVRAYPGRMVGVGELTAANVTKMLKTDLYSSNEFDYDAFYSCVDENTWEINFHELARRCPGLLKIAFKTITNDRKPAVRPFMHDIYVFTESRRAGVALPDGPRMAGLPGALMLCYSSYSYDLFDEPLIMDSPDKEHLGRVIERLEAECGDKSVMRRQEESESSRLNGVKTRILNDAYEAAKKLQILTASEANNKKKKAHGLATKLVSLLNRVVPSEAQDKVYRPADVTVMKLIQSCMRLVLEFSSDWIALTRSPLAVSNDASFPNFDPAIYYTKHITTRMRARPQMDSVVKRKEANPLARRAKSRGAEAKRREPAAAEARLVLPAEGRYEEPDFESSKARDRRAESSAETGGGHKWSAASLGKGTKSEQEKIKREIAAFLASIGRLSASRMSSRDSKEENERKNDSSIDKARFVSANLGATPLVSSYMNYLEKEVIRFIFVYAGGNGRYDESYMRPLTPHIGSLYLPGTPRAESNVSGPMIDVALLLTVDEETAIEMLSKLDASFPRRRKELIADLDVAREALLKLYERKELISSISEIQEEAYKILFYLDVEAGSRKKPEDDAAKPELSTDDTYVTGMFEAGKGTGRRTVALSGGEPYLEKCRKVVRSFFRIARDHFAEVIGVKRDRDGEAKMSLKDPVRIFDASLREDALRKIDERKELIGRVRKNHWSIIKALKLAIASHFFHDASSVHFREASDENIIREWLNHSHGSRGVGGASSSSSAATTLHPALELWAQRAFELTGQAKARLWLYAPTIDISSGERVNLFEAPDAVSLLEARERYLCEFIAPVSWRALAPRARAPFTPSLGEGRRNGTVGQMLSDLRLLMVALLSRSDSDDLLESKDSMFFDKRNTDGKESFTKALFSCLSSFEKSTLTPKEVATQATLNDAVRAIDANGGPYRIVGHSWPPTVIKGAPSDEPGGDKSKAKQSKAGRSGEKASEEPDGDGGRDDGDAAGSSAAQAKKTSVVCESRAAKAAYGFVAPDNASASADEIAFVARFSRNPSVLAYQSFYDLGAVKSEKSIEKNVLCARWLLSIWNSLSKEKGDQPVGDEPRGFSAGKEGEPFIVTAYALHEHLTKRLAEPHRLPGGEASSSSAASSSSSGDYVSAAMREWRAIAARLMAWPPTAEPGVAGATLADVCTIYSCVLGAVSATPSLRAPAPLERVPRHPMFNETLPRSVLAVSTCIALGITDIGVVGVLGEALIAARRAQVNAPDASKVREQATTAAVRRILELVELRDNRALRWSTARLVPQNNEDADDEEEDGDYDITNSKF